MRAMQVRGDVMEPVYHTFDDFADRQWPVLWRFFFAQCRDRQLSEDLTQETLLRLFRAYGRPPDGEVAAVPDGAPPWERAMWTAARHLWVETLRRRRPAESIDTRVKHDALSTDGGRQAREALLDLAPRIRRLSAAQRRALELQLAGLGRDEIGARLGRTAEQVHDLLRAARRRLRDAPCAATCVPRCMEAVMPPTPRRRSAV